MRFHYILPLLVALLATCVSARAPAFASSLRVSGGPFDCLGTDTAEACDGYDSCSWCNSTSVGTGCYPMQIAKMLPKKYFDCDKYPEDDDKPAAQAAPVQGVQPTDCFSQNVTQCKYAKKTCQWCEPDSGMGSCYSKDVAKYIPFCNKADHKGKLAQSQAAAAEASAEQGMPSYDCFSQNVTQCKDAKKTCQWCVSDTGMGSCYSKDVAKYIPFCNKADGKGELTQPQTGAESASTEDKKKPSASDCLKLNTSKSCDKNDLCSWCTTSGLGTGCYPKKVADYLPETVFKCDKPSDACIKQGTEDKCAEQKGCAWCKTGGIGTGCYPEKVAEKLPKKFFTCDAEDAPEESPKTQAAQHAGPRGAAASPSPFDCMSKKNASACNDLEACSWCETSGLGTGCYPQKVAKILPHKYFECDKVELALGDPKCEKKSEDECAAPTCVWCSSAAVGGGCYTPEEAQRLPQAVFSCKTAPSTFAAV